MIVQPLCVSLQQQRRSPFSLSGSPNLKNQLSGSLEVAPRSRWDVSITCVQHNKSVFCSSSIFSLFGLLQTFQRIQRNRQSRIRVKLSRRAGKRSDEILEEDIVEPVSNSHDHHHHHHHNHHQQNHHAFRKMEQPQSSSTPGREKVFPFSDIVPHKFSINLSYFLQKNQLFFFF